MSTVNSSYVWRKSSYSDSSGAECVEVASVPANWHKSSYSDSSGGSCVEVGSVVVVTGAQPQESGYSTHTEDQWAGLAPIVPTISTAERRKNSLSTGTRGTCVEVGDVAAVAVRDSKDPDGPKLIFGPSAWQAFATQVKNGTLDLA